jgi:hypothetical protein
MYFILVLLTTATVGIFNVRELVAIIGNGKTGRLNGKGSECFEDRSVQSDGVLCFSCWNIHTLHDAY